MDKNIGILLVNLGSPDAPTPKAVRKYLHQFLTDRRIIELPPILWWPILHGVVLRTRPAKSAKAYEMIWEKQISGEFAPHSLLIDITQQQAKALQEHMPSNVHVQHAMRYGTPSIKHGLRELSGKNCQEILVLPLYPQYAGATTRSAYDAIEAAQAQIKKLPKLILSRHYYNHPDYISAITDSLDQHLKGLEWSADKILVSFHGLPKSSIKKGDPYERECQATYDLIKSSASELSHKMMLTFQSRFGPKKWLEPYTKATLREAARSGHKNIVIITPGFAADCLETMEELAINAKEDFLNCGGENLSVVPCLNANPAHITALANIAKEHL